MTRRWVTIVGLVVVFALAGAVRLTRHDPGQAAAATASSAPASARSEPAALTFAQCQVAVATQGGRPDCGYRFMSTALSIDDPAADPNDSRYAGAALPIGQSSGGQKCMTGPGRPVLDTIRPTLSAYFTAASGVPSLETTFQVRGVDDPIVPPLDLGEQRMPASLPATLDFRREGPLKHGVSYRWRVRGLPLYIADAGGWSPWCEFTVGAVTSDDLGLDNARRYPVTLPIATWRAILAALGPVETYTDGGRSTQAPIADAVKAAHTASALSVTMTGSGWSDLVNALSYRASEDDASYWRLADLLSAALGGPPRVTMGFERR